MATGPIETHLHHSFNWENGAPGAREGPRGRSVNCGSEPSAQCVRLRSEINLHETIVHNLICSKLNRIIKRFKLSFAVFTLKSTSYSPICNTRILRQKRSMYIRS